MQRSLRAGWGGGRSVGRRSRAFKRLDSGTDRSAMASPGVLSSMRSAAETRPGDARAGAAGGRRAAAAARAAAHPARPMATASRSPRRPRRREPLLAGSRPRRRAARPRCSDAAAASTLLERVKRERPEVEVIVMTGHASIESAVGCIRRGAFDYLAKPFDDVHRVRTTVRQGARAPAAGAPQPRARGRAARARRAARAGRARAADARALGRTIESLRHNESHVLIQGESGTGKELVARAIHAAQPARRAAPSCRSTAARCPRSIIESELFGHERAPSPARSARPACSGWRTSGTLFLDEIGEIPAPVQAKLLRALQEQGGAPGRRAAPRCRSTSA